LKYNGKKIETVLKDTSGDKIGTDTECSKFKICNNKLYGLNFPFNFFAPAQGSPSHLYIINDDNTTKKIEGFTGDTREIFFSDAISYKNNLYIILYDTNNPGTSAMFKLKSDGNSVEKLNIQFTAGAKFIDNTLCNDLIYCVGSITKEGMNYPYITIFDGKKFKDVLKYNENTNDKRGELFTIAAKKEKKEDNMALILGLALGIGIPILAIAIYFIYMKYV
tara:strand:- start:1333 stop:1995 length:663 start_codon:yes stop_codon:yes gene_type:complete